MSELTARPDRRRVLRRAWPLIRPHRGVLLAAVLASLATTLATLAGPVLVGVAIDAAAAGRRSRLAAAAAGYGFAVVALFGLERARRRLAARAGEAVLADLRATVARHLLARPLAFFDRHPAGELVSRATTDVDALSGFVRSGLPDLVGALLLLGVTSFVLVGTSWPLAMLTLAYLPGLVLAVRRFHRSSGPAYAAYAEAAARTTAVLGETLAARPLLQGIDASGRWAERAAEVDRALLAANDAALRADNRLSVLGFWQQITLALVLVGGGLLVERGTATVGGVATVALALRQLYRPLDALSWLVAEAQQARANLARILEVAPHPVPVGRSTANDGASLAPVGRNGLPIDLSGVTYRYPGDDRTVPAVSAVDLRIEAGERVALVGSTGAGKSTVAKLAAGLLQPSAGTVRVGGVDVADWDPAALRRAIVLLPQEGHVMAGTLADNLRLVPGQHADEELLASVERAGLAAWVAGLPAGLDTVLADRGANVSAGERQLISLARAALADPAVLILDEATADIDPATEALVTAASERLTAGRTVLVVAHRPATAARFRRVVTLAGGRLVSDESSAGSAPH